MSNLFTEENNLFVRIYNISLELYNLKYYTSLRGIIFNDFIGIGFSAFNNSINEYNISTYFTLLSYVNSTDISPINDLFGKNDEHILNIKKYIYIENNIFGYELIGIRLFNINELKNNGLILFDSFNEIINENDTISYDIDNIIIKKNLTGVNFGKYHFNFAGIASEPKDYDEFGNYFQEGSDIFSDSSNGIQYKNIYNPRNFTGKISNFEFTIESCYKTCSQCNNILGNSIKHYCTICKDGYSLNESANICELKISETLENGDCPEDSPYLYKEDNKCKAECEVIDLFDEKCIPNNITTELEEEIRENIEKEITSHSMDDLLDNITDGVGEDLRIDAKDIKYHITSSLRQYNIEYDDISSIKLGDCENILRQKYGLINNETLLIFKMDLFINSSTIPVVIYEVYHPITKEKLDLNYCKGIKIDISYPVKVNENELFKYNQSSEYYSDICWTDSTQDHTDISIKDRQEEFINNNMSLCEEDCDYNYYDKDTKKVSCQCFIKINIPIISEIKVDKEKLKKNFIEINNIINLNVMKCYKLLLEKDGIITNLGFYILLFIIFIYTICAIYFCIKGYNNLYDEVKKINDFKKNATKTSNKIHNDNTPRLNKKEKTKLKGRNNKKISIKKKYEKTTEGNKSPKLMKLKKNNIKKKNKKTTKDNKHSKTIKMKKQKTRNKNNIKPIKINNKNKKNNNPPKKRAKIKMKILSSSRSPRSKSKSRINLIESNILDNVTRNLNNTSTKNNLNKKKKSNIMNYNDSELNTLDYELALKFDKRRYFQYYKSILKTRHLLLFAIIQSNDYNSMIIKFCIFLFTFSLNYAINALFFDDSTLHIIYLSQGEFNFVYQLPKMIYSLMISVFINLIIKYLSLSEKKILGFKRDERQKNSDFKMKEMMKCLKINFTLFYLLSFVFLFFFLFYLSCFCVVYKNTQLHLIKDTLISFGISLIYPFGLYLLPGIFRIPSLKDSTNKCLYRISKIIQLFL